MGLTPAILQMRTSELMKMQAFARGHTSSKFNSGVEIWVYLKLSSEFSPTESMGSLGMESNRIRGFWNFKIHVDPWGPAQMRALTQ